MEGFFGLKSEQLLTGTSRIEDELKYACACVEICAGCIA